MSTDERRRPPDSVTDEDPGNAPLAAPSVSALTGKEGLEALRAIMRAARCDDGQETAALDRIYGIAYRATSDQPPARPPAVPALPLGARQQEAAERDADGARKAMLAATCGPTERAQWEALITKARNRAIAAEADAGAAYARGRKERDAEWREALAMMKPWPVTSVLDRLAGAAEHLLDTHGCDAHGYEGVQIAVGQAREIVAMLRALPGSAATASASSPPASSEGTENTQEAWTPRAPDRGGT